MRIDSQLLKDLIHADYEHADYEGDTWSVIEDEIVDTWRWGINNRIILKRTSVDGLDSFWGFDYQVETSNEEYIYSFQDDSEVELWKAVAIPIAKLEYRKENSGS